MHDTRNVTDEFKGMPEERIVEVLDERGVILEIAVENLQRDFSMGTIIRSANAFGVRTVHVIGRRQWNKRGAMMTDKYLTLKYHATLSEFLAAVQDKSVIAVDIVDGAESMHQAELPRDTVLVFGAEGAGVSPELIAASDKVVKIDQLGSTRSINVGVAAGIAMYDWLRRHHL